MGALCPNPGAAQGEEQSRSRSIDAQLRKDKKVLEHEVKLLLLGTCFIEFQLELIFLAGAGESGKSTFAKQMKIIHLQGFSEDERLQYKEIIHSNVILSMRALVVALQKAGGLDSLKAENKVELLQTFSF